MATNAFAAFIEGKQAGQQARAYQQQQEDRNALRTLAPKILAGDPDAFNQAAAIDPKAATAVQDAGDSQLRRLRGALDYFGQALESGDDRVIQARFKEISPFLSRVTGNPAPPAWTEEMRPAFEQARQRVAMATSAAAEGMPAGYRQFQLMAEAAGLKPGTPEYQQAAKISLGQEGRASSAGFGFDSIDIGDGRPRPSRQNPRTGALEYYDERVGGWVQLGGPAAMGMPAPTAPTAPAATPQRGAPSAVTGTPADAEEAAGLANAYYQQLRAAGLPDEQATQATEVYLQGLQRQSASAPASAGVPPATAAPAPSAPSAGAPLLVPDMQRGGLVAPPGIGAGRSKEQEAAATEAAKLGVQLQYLPQELALRSQAAVDQAVGIERGKTAVEQAAAAPAAIETMQSSIKVIDELLADPDLGTIVGMGSVNPLNYLPGSKARGLIARAEQISGKAFLAAFNQLKGAGAITEKEGEAATRAMARLDRSQSLEDYRTALIDLRDAIAPALARQQAILARGHGPAQPQSAGAPRVQTPDDYARLPSGATYIAPDGSVRRKK